MDDADDNSTRASLIQSLRGLPAETAADPLAESLLDNDSQADFERLFDVSAAAKPTDLAAASKKFAGVLEASASNVLGAMLTPLWIASVIGPGGLGPAGLWYTGGWRGRWAGWVCGLLALASLPLQQWVARLADAWPSAYDACLRAAAAPEDDAEDDDAAVDEEEAPPPDDAEEPRCVRAFDVGDAASSVNEFEEDAPPDANPPRPPGATVLACAAALVTPLACVAFLGAVGAYAGDAVAMTCTRTVEDGDGREYQVRTALYPWDCAWTSAAALCTRSAGAAAATLAVVPPAAFAAHCLALRAALKEEGDGGDEDLAAGALVDDANAIWRRATLLWLAAAAVVFGLGVRDLVCLLAADGALVLRAPAAAATAAGVAGASGLPVLGLICLANGPAPEGVVFVHACLSKPGRAAGSALLVALVAAGLGFV